MEPLYLVSACILGFLFTGGVLILAFALGAAASMADDANERYADDVLAEHERLLAEDKQRQAEYYRRNVRMVDGPRKWQARLNRYDNGGDR